MMGLSKHLWVVVALAVCLPLAALAETGPACTKVYAACKAAGFELSAKAAGSKLKQDCVGPLLGGTRATGGLALPKVDAAVLAACQAEQGNTPSGKAAKAPSGKAAKAAVDAARLDGRHADGKPPVAAKALPAAAKRGPNIVLILTDDFSLDLMTAKSGVLAESMPNLARMMQQGATFPTYFVTDSLCCPSRSSIFTGMLPHNSGVLTNAGSNGGYGAFMAHDDDAKTFAVALHDGFYQTSMMGKYLNGYNPVRDGVPQGWSDWAVTAKGYTNFDYVLNVNGMLVAPAEHLTDAISQQGQAFITRAAGGPFFLELASFSPHAPFTPPARYADAFPDVTYPHSPAFAARPDANAPAWLQEMPALTKRDIALFNRIYRKRVQSDKGVDDMIGAVRQTLDDLGLTDTTYVIFSSDNGYHMGEYSLGTGKMTPFDTDIKVPLVVVGPGVAAGVTIDAIAMNIDLAPTFAEMAGVPPLASFDGHSLLGLLHGGTTPARSLAVVEHEHSALNPDDPDTETPVEGAAEPGNPPTYVALRFKDALYVEYLDGTGVVGYYDLKSDPYQLHNIAPTLPAARLAALHAAMLANHSCQGATSCGAAMALAP
jgi:N-acetylglucosamine-6-sulfatase